MTQEGLSPQLLFQLVLMDTVGVLLFVLGFYDGFFASEPLLPESFAFGGYPYVLIGLGALFQVPTIVTFVVRRGRHLRE